MAFRVEKYNSSYFKKWNDFVEASLNGTIFQRLDFLDYHQNRFTELEHHCIWFKGEAIYAVMPCVVESIEGVKIARSPYGASFGGPVVSPKFKFKYAFELVESLINYLKEIGVSKLVLTIPPPVYYKQQSFNLDFTISRIADSWTREIFNIIPLQQSVKPFDKYEGRARTTLRKIKDKFNYFPNASLNEFYPILVEDKIRHNNSKPTHTREDLTFLMKSFPDRIWFDIAVNSENSSKAGICYFKVSEKCLMTFYMCQENDSVGSDGTNFLVDKRVCWAHDQGYQFFDFGGSTIGFEVQNAGVIAFKESFGAVAYLRDKYTIEIK